MKQQTTYNAPRPDTVPTCVYDDAVANAVHREKMHWIVHIIELVIIVLIVGAFLLYLNQYEYVSNETVTVDGQTGVANYIGKDGNIYNGEDNGAQNQSAGQEEPQLEENPET